MEFKFLEIKAHTLSSREDNRKMIKIYGEYLIFFYQKYMARFNQTWHKAFLVRGNSDFLKIKTHALLQGEIKANL